MAAIDPVCGMTVEPASAPARHEYQEKTYYFCNPGCRTKFAANPERYLTGGVVEPMTAVGRVKCVSPGTQYICPMDADVVSDRPGRSFSSSRGSLRHSFEAKHDHHKLEKHKFSTALADMLDDACGRMEFDQLVLVAPHRSLGELRGLLSARVRRSICKEIAGDLTGVTPATLWRHLQPTVASEL